jgi:hypothetical protein
LCILFESTAAENVKRSKLGVSSELTEPPHAWTPGAGQNIQAASIAFLQTARERDKADVK